MISKGIKYIDLYAVFERPTLVNDFLNENNNESITNDDRYPVGLDMIDEIERIVINKLSAESSQPIDDINDSSDTIKQSLNRE